MASEDLSAINFGGFSIFFSMNVLSIVEMVQISPCVVNRGSVDIRMHPSYSVDIRNKNDLFMNQEVAASFYDLADGSINDWFGGILYSAGQQANEAVLDQLSSLSFTRCTIIFFKHYFVSIISPENWKLCLWFVIHLFVFTVWQ